MIPINAKACSFCGSDEQTGWSDQTYLDGIDIGDEDNYNELVNKEFGVNKIFIPLWKLLTGLVVIIIFILFLIRSLF